MDGDRSSWTDRDSQDGWRHQTPTVSVFKVGSDGYIPLVKAGTDRDNQDGWRQEKGRMIRINVYRRR